MIYELLFHDMNESNESQNQHNERGMVMRQMQAFSGPLPHPDILKRFDEVVPGAAERILVMAEEQSAHRRSLERKVIDSDIARSKWGQVLGFCIAIAGLVASGWIAVYGSAITGGVIGAGTLASLVWVFMYGAKTRSKERIEKSHSEERIRD